MNILAKMEKLTDKYMEGYKTDYSVHDVATLKADGPLKKTFYWLIRKCGTQLYSLSDFEAAGNWNMLDNLKYHSFDYIKFFKIDVDTFDGEQIDGSIKECSYEETVKLFENRIRKPLSILFTYRNQTFEMEWYEELTHYDAMLAIREHFENNEIYWNQVDYSFKFE